MLISDIPSMGGEETAAHASSAVRRIGRVKDALSLPPTHTPEDRSDFRGYALEPSTNVEGYASIGRLLGVDHIANVDTFIVETVGKRPVGVDRRLDATDSLAGALRCRVWAARLVVEVAPVVNLLDIEIIALETPERLFDALRGVHSKAFGPADAGKGEGGEGGSEGDGENAVHDLYPFICLDGRLSLQGIVCVTTWNWRSPFRDSMG